MARKEEDGRIGPQKEAREIGFPERDPLQITDQFLLYMLTVMESEKFSEWSGPMKFFPSPGSR